MCTPQSIKRKKEKDQILDEKSILLIGDLSIGWYHVNIIWGCF